MGVIAWIVLGAVAGLIAERVTGSRTGLLLATCRAERHQHRVPGGATRTSPARRAPPSRSLLKPYIGGFW
jgi:hypothetical protein